MPADRYKIVLAMQNFCAIEVQLLVDWRIEAKLRKHNLFYLQRRNKIQTIINQRLEYMKFQWLVRSNIWRYGYSGVRRRSKNLHYCVKFSNSAMMSDTLWAHWLECPAETSSRVNRSCMGIHFWNPVSWYLQDGSRIHDKSGQRSCHSWWLANGCIENIAKET